MRPNQGFVNSLKGLDPLLSVRYGDFVHQWVIERKGAITTNEIKYLNKRVERAAVILQNSADLHPNQVEKTRATYLGVNEEVISAKQGKRVIVFAKFLNQQLYDALVLSDMQRFGGYARFADELEKAEAQREKDVERQLENKRMALHKESYDMLNFLWRKRSDALLNGQRDLRYLLHGQHSTESSPPLIKLTDF